ncbi:asparagine synthetase B family protein [Kitasatospora mediocidica]|uniref:asparagine synthetase B family protein n=1 Tax=Kitasatospora mediocidica TaxID=58352 RepID=UPI00056D61C5|nr:asparagine synthase-related protein [Kitasatospora mediocidica]
MDEYLCRWTGDGRPPTWGASLTTVSRGPYTLAFTGSLLRPAGEGGRTDGEALLGVLAEHGVPGLAAVDGQFVFALWDEDRRRLTVGRDRLGLKTVYWSQDARGVTFATRMTVLADSGSRRLNVPAAIDFLVNGFTDQDDNTLLDGVYQLPPGSVLELDAGNWRPGAAAQAIRPWYRLPEPGTLDLTATEAAAEFRERLRESVRLAAGSSGTALLLSGGIDSSTIAAFTSVSSYKACFGIPEHDQEEIVAQVVARRRAPHHRADVRGADLLDRRDALLAALEVPYERSIAAAHWTACEAMAVDGVRVTLDGVGSDELLGGYVPWHSSFEPLAAGQRVPGLPFLSTSHPAECFTPGRDLSLDLGWLADDVRPAGVAAMQDGRFPAIGSFGELCRHHLRYGALPILLRYNREIGAAFGQEARSPFLDHRLVELSLGLGAEHKLVDGRTKYVLRLAADGLVPETLLRPAEKKSYSSVEMTWLLASLDRLREEAANAAAEWPGLLDAAGLRGPTDAARAARPGKTEVLRLWRVTCFAAWARLFDVKG